MIENGAVPYEYAADPLLAAEFERTQLLVTDRFSGFFLIPGPEGVWNYAFQSINHSKSMKYVLQADNPSEFYAECHRPAHFLQFSGVSNNEDDSGTWKWRRLKGGLAAISL